MASFLFSIFGLFIGSFLGVIVSRTGAKSPILFGRSECPFCHSRLGFFDLIPLVSFFARKGRCRHCGKRISFFYPVIEITTGASFGVIFWRVLSLPVFGRYLSFFNIQEGWWVYLLLIFWSVFASILIIISFYDFLHFIIPDKYIIAGVAAALLYIIFLRFIPQNQQFLNVNLVSNFLAAAIGFSFFGLIFLISKGVWMGFGDAKLAAFIGLILGWPGLLLAAAISFLLGGIFGIILMAIKKYSLKSEIPFGPFLAVGTFIALLGGNFLANLYFSIFQL